EQADAEVAAGLRDARVQAPVVGVGAAGAVEHPAREHAVRVVMCGYVFEHGFFSGGPARRSLGEGGRRGGQACPPRPGSSCSAWLVASLVMPPRPPSPPFRISRVYSPISCALRKSPLSASGFTQKLRPCRGMPYSLSRSSSRILSAGTQRLRITRCTPKS